MANAHVAGVICPVGLPKACAMNAKNKWVNKMTYLLREGEKDCDHIWSDTSERDLGEKICLRCGRIEVLR
jgi:hypothetical protein